MFPTGGLRTLLGGPRHHSCVAALFGETDSVENGMLCVVRPFHAATEITAHRTTQGITNFRFAKVCLCFTKISLIATE